MVQFDRGVERHQMGCSSTPGESRECSTSTQRERAPRVPMRLARGKRRPASIAVRQATSRVTVTAEQGHQHLSSAGQTEFANDCLMTFCEVTCVERGKFRWLAGGRPEFSALCTTRIPLCTPPGSPTNRSLAWQKISQNRGQVGACTSLPAWLDVACTRARKTEILVFGGPASQRGGQK